MRKNPPVRFRIVLEAIFPTADPLNPSGYSLLLERWRESLGRNRDVPCRDATIRESLRIGDTDDYEDWRSERGEYDPSAWPEEGIGKIRGGTPGSSKADEPKNK